MDSHDDSVAEVLFKICIGWCIFLTGLAVVQIFISTSFFVKSRELRKERAQLTEEWNRLQLEKK